MGVLEKKNDLIVKSNRLNQALFSLDTVEYKFVLYVASKIKKDDKDFKTYTIPVKDFTKAIGVRGNNYYVELKKISKDIMSKPVGLFNGKNYAYVNWFSYFEYQEDEGTIKVRFDKVLKPFLLNLEGEFFKYTFQQIAQLKSVYSIRIFELVKQWVSARSFTIDLEELREMLDLKEKYPRFPNFKQRILNRSKEEIVIKTDLRFDFEEIREGRTVKRIRFYNISFMEKQLSLFGDNLEEEDKEFKEKLKEAFEVIGIYLGEKEFKKLEKYSENMVYSAVEQLKYRMEKDGVEKPISYLFGILKNMENSSNGENDSEAAATEEEEDDDIHKQLQRSLLKKYEKNSGTIAKSIIWQEAMDLLKSEFGIEDYSNREKIWTEMEKETVKKIKDIGFKNKLKKGKY